MKHSIYLIALALFAFASCDKKKNDTPINTVDYIQDLSYKIDGIKDVTVNELGETSITLDVIYIDSAVSQNRLVLSVEGLPAETEYSFSTNDTLPGFRTTLKIRSLYANRGEFPITIVGVSSNGKKREFSTKVSIVPGMGNGGTCEQLVNDPDYFKSSKTYEIINGQEVEVNTGGLSYTLFGTCAILLGENPNTKVQYSNQYSLSGEVIKTFNCDDRTFTVKDATIHRIDMGVNYYFMLSNGKGRFTKDSYTFVYDVTLNGQLRQFKLVAELKDWQKLMTK